MQIFTINSDDIKGRLDCYYYQPEFTILEKKVKKITNKTLGDYILNIAGGATPDKDESEKYYAQSGIPFLRVQNITTEGLNLTDVKYINNNTHNNLLKRSKVKEYNLLIKITGVGRMAISAVAPKSFDGNINQHLVVIQTRDKETSETIAAFLNSDIGEKLASRRSTGGTRPALDYQALKTTPIVYKPSIVKIMQSACQQKHQKQREAQRLLDSIDEYVMQELGITMPEMKNQMIFTIYSDEIKGKRIDPKGYSQNKQAIYQSIINSKYQSQKLGNLILESISGEWGEDIYDGKIDITKFEKLKVIRNTNFNNKINLDLNDIAERMIPKSKIDKVTLKNGDLLIEKSGGSPIQPVGRVALFFEKTGDKFTFSNFLQCLRIDSKIIDPYYLFYSLRMIYGLGYMEYLQNQTTGIKNLIMEEFFNIPIPIPALETQKKISKETENRVNKAKMFQQEALECVEQAKKQVEEMILTTD